MNYSFWPQASGIVNLYPPNPSLAYHISNPFSRSFCTSPNLPSHRPDRHIPTVRHSHSIDPAGCCTWRGVAIIWPAQQHIYRFREITVARGDDGRYTTTTTRTVDDDDVVSCQKWHPSPASYIGRYDASGPNINRWWWVRWWVLEDLPSWKHRGVRDLEGFFSIWLTFMGWMWVASCFRSEKLELHPCVSIFLLFRMQHDAGTYI